MFSTGGSDEDSNFDRDPERKLQIASLAPMEVEIPSHKPVLHLRNQGTSRQSIEDRIWRDGRPKILTKSGFATGADRDSRDPRETRF